MNIESLSESFLKNTIINDSDDGDIDISYLEPEIELINDPHIKTFVRFLLKNAIPFWRAPASLSPGVHPQDEEGELGLALHTKRVVRICMLLIDTIQLDQPLSMDYLIASALLHDVTKFCLDVDKQELIYDPMHPYTVDKYADWARLESASRTSGQEDNALEIDDESLAVIMRIIRCSHGIWSPIPETIPIGILEKTLHEADLMAANLHYIVDGPKHA